MGKWSVVPGMHLKPYRCLGCGSTPRDDNEEGRPNKNAYFCEAVDVNWGDSVFLCDTCVRILGELRGMVDVPVHEKLKNQFEKLRKEYVVLEKDHSALELRVERMLDGVRAKKEVSETRQKREGRKKVAA